MNRQQQTRARPQREHGYLNVKIAGKVHHDAKLVCTDHGLTWDQAVEEALIDWTAKHQATR